MNLVTILDMAASGFGDRVAISGRGARLTFADLHRRAAAGAARLRGSYPNVVFIGESGPEFATAFFASAGAGIPLVPLNYRLAMDRLVALLDAHPEALVVADRHIADELPGREVLRSSEWMTWTERDEPGSGWVDAPDQPALFLYTSGTTSEPKGAILRHSHLTSYLFGSVEFGAAAEDDAALVSVPPYHIAGVANLLTNVYSGRRVVYLPRFTPEEWLETVREERVTQSMLVPTMLALIVEALGDADDAGTPTLRTISYGGSHMPRSVLTRVLELFPGVDLVNAYGLTETSSTIAVLGPEEHRAGHASSDPVALRRLSSVGKIIPGIEVEVRDPRGTPLPEGQTGELWVRGPQISGEYAGLQSPRDADGWFPTRDAGSIDEDGYLYVEGRIDDTIIRGGENITPTEIEEVLIGHPAVIDAGVVGVADTKWGQRIAAAVVVRETDAVTTEELREWARSRLRGSKTPDEIVLRDVLPRTDTGKLQRKLLLAELVQQELSADA